MFSTDISIILTGSLLLTLMAISVIGFIIYYQRKQFKLELIRRQGLQEIQKQYQLKLLRNSLEVQESERKKISNDLHDEIGGLLSATKLNIKTIIKEQKELNTSKSNFENVQNLIDEALLQVRNLSKDLSPRTLENFGLLPALNEFFSKMEKASGVSFQFNTNNIFDDERFDTPLELAIYRLIQELTNNALKHAEANQIKIELSKKNDQIYLNFDDNGKGFDFEAARKNIKSGLGLGNIISRIEVLGGNYQFKSLVKNGTHVVINLPLKTGSHE